MKLKFIRLITLLFIILTFLNYSFVFANSEELNIISESAILMNNETEKVLYSKNENKKMYPASTTKIVTAILTLENCNLNDIVTVSYNAVMSIPDGYSSASLQIGEKLTVEQLLNLLLVCSANDAANVLAEHVGGSINSFISMMNTKVHELGLSNTHFTNAYGKHDENHYTTAYDLAMIMKHCIKNENFRRISGSASCVLPATNKYGTRQFPSTNELIIPNNSNYYSYLTCGKTGYTSQAGDCLVSCSYKDNFELICVILGGKSINNVSTRFSETKKLYEYGYTNFSIKNIVNENNIITQIEIPNATKQTKNLDLLAGNSISTLLKNDMFENNLPFEINLNDNIHAPIEQGDCLGYANYTIDGIDYKIDLIASHSVEKSNFHFFIGFLSIFLICIFLLIRKKRRHR